MELAAGPQDARDRGDALVLDEARFPMPPCRPRIGIKQIDACERGRWQPFEQKHDIVEVQPDIGEIFLLDRRQSLGHSVDERLDPDKAGAWMLFGLRDHVLAATES